MRIGMVGLGRMGSGMTRRLLRDGHEVVVHDLSRDAMSKALGGGAESARSLDELVAALTPPRPVWVMILAVFAGPTLEALGRLPAPRDVVVGGNSRYTDTLARVDMLAAGIGLADGVHQAVRGDSRRVTA